MQSFPNYSPPPPHPEISLLIMSSIHQLFVCYFNNQILVSHYRSEAGVFLEQICTNSRRAISRGARPRQTGAMLHNNLFRQLFRQLATVDAFCSDIFFAHRSRPRRCQALPMVGTKGFSDRQGEQSRWQTITNPITAQLASLPRRYPWPSAPWSSGHHHCYH